MISVARLADVFIRGEKAHAVATSATYLGLAITVWPSFRQLIASISDRAVLASVAWGTFLLLVAAWAVWKVLQRPPRLLPRGKIFQPFVSISELRPWPRSNEVSQIQSLLKAEPAYLPTVVGPSGVGKTVILRRLLPDALQLEGDQLKYFDQYLDFPEQLSDQISLFSTDGVHRTRYIVLDQFEQFVARISQFSVAAQQQQWDSLRHLISEVRGKGIRVIVSIRHEWYYELRPLGTILPNPSQCIDVSGIRSSNSDQQTMRTLTLQLRNALKDDANLAPAIVEDLLATGQVVPIEAQIVGATIESLKLDGRRLDDGKWRDEIQGVPGAVDIFFDDLLAGAPDRRISLKLLAALSATTRFRRQISLTDIYDVLFEPQSAVRQCVHYLIERGVVVERGDWGHVELVHDFLAEYFHNRCGYELRPTERDNVAFLLQASPPNLGPAVASREERERRSGVLGWIIFALLAAIMFLRLLGLGLDWTLVGDLQPMYSSSTDIFDAAYVPIFVGHGAWVIYITLFYVRILDMLDERSIARAMSNLAPIVMAICVLVAVFIPYAWMFSIGCGGLFLGAKLLTMSRSPRIGAGGKARLAEFGRTTCAALLFLTALGAAGMWISFALQDNAGFGEQWVAVSLFAALTMTVFCLALTPYHIKRPAVAELLGLIARSPRALPQVRRDTSPALRLDQEVVS